MKKQYYKNELKNIIDSAGEFQIIDLEKYEIRAYLIQPRIKDSRFSYATKTCNKSTKKDGE